MEQTGFPLYFTAAIIFTLIWALMLLLNAKKHRVSLLSAGVFSLLAILLGLFFARFIYCINPEKIETVFYDEWGEYIGLSPFFKPEAYGFHIGGFLIGILLAALLAKLITKAKFYSLLDNAAMPSLFLYSAMRFVEPLSGEGKGLSDIMENVKNGFAPIFTKLATFNEDTWAMEVQWKLSVYFIEAILALILLFVLCKRTFAPGTLTLYTFVLFFTSQLLPESFRQDGHLCVSIFVRVTYIAYLVGLMLVHVLIMFRMLLDSHQRKRIRILILETVLLAIGIGAFVWTEYALDKTNISDSILYPLMALVLCGLAFLSCQRIYKEDQRLCSAK